MKTGKKLLSVLLSLMLVLGAVAVGGMSVSADGSLNVINRDAKYEITIGGVAGSIIEKVYDGDELVVTGYTVNAEVTNATFSNWIANHVTDTQNVESSFTLTTPDGNAETYVVSIPKGKVTARQTDVGTDYYKWQESDVTITSNGVDVTNDFMIQLEPVSATVTKKQITLTSGFTLDFIYDGDPHRNMEVEISGRLEKDRDLAVFEFSGFPSVTNVGEVKSNEFTLSLTGEKAGNYSYKTVFGQIGVVARPIDDLLDSTTIFANSGGGTYNGRQQSVSGWQFAVNDLIEFTCRDNKYYVDVTDLPVGATGTNVSDSKETSYSGTYRILDSKGIVVTDQFKPVTMKMGTLAIEPVALTITSASGERGYNGNVYRLDEASVTDGEFVGEEGATYNFTGGRVKLGSVENTFTYTLKPNTLAENYDITTAFGTLNVIDEAGAFDVTVTAASDSILYDGTIHVIDSFAAGVDEDATVDGIQTTIDGNTYTITGLSVNQSAKDATEGVNVNVTGTPIVTDDAGNNITDSFTVHVASGKLVINRRNVTLTSPNRTYIYDGTDHVIGDDEIIVGGDGWALGEGVSYSKTSIRNVGTRPNEFTYTMLEGTREENYNIDKVEGTLEVTDDGVSPENVVQLAISDSGAVYNPGDEITYTVTVTNIYDNPETVTLTMPDGIILEQSVFENIVPGDSVNTVARHTVSSEDIIAGNFDTSVEADLAGKSFTVSHSCQSIAVKNADISVTVRLSAVNGEAVAPGESVTAKIGDRLTFAGNATNNGNVDLTDVIVYDRLTGVAFRVGTLKPGDTSEDITLLYTVTTADIAAGKIIDSVEVTAETDDGEDVSSEAEVEVSAKTEYKVTYAVDGKEFATLDASYGQPVPQPDAPQRDGYSFAWTDEIPEKMPAEDITINGSFTLIEYTARFVNEAGETIKEETFTVKSKSITEPEVPEKAGYTGKWSEYTIGASDMTINPVYTPIEYTATFVDENGEILKEVTFTVETGSLEEPEVPAKEGYDGAWEEYELGAGNITIKPVYTPTNICKLDGEYHGDTFFGKLITFFHNLIWTAFSFIGIDLFFSIKID